MAHYLLMKFLYLTLKALKTMELMDAMMPLKMEVQDVKRSRTLDLMGALINLKMVNNL